MLARFYRQAATLSGPVPQAEPLILDFAALLLAFGLRVVGASLQVPSASALCFSVVT